MRGWKYRRGGENIVTIFSPRGEDIVGVKISSHNGIQNGVRKSCRTLRVNETSTGLRQSHGHLDIVYHFVLMRESRNRLIIPHESALSLSCANDAVPGWSTYQPHPLCSVIIINSCILLAAVIVRIQIQILNSLLYQQLPTWEINKVILVD